MNLVANYKLFDHPKDHHLVGVMIACPYRDCSAGYSPEWVGDIDDEIGRGHSVLTCPLCLRQAIVFQPSRGELVVETFPREEDE